MAIFTPISTITQTTTPAEHQVRDVSQTLSLLDADIYPLDTMTRNLPAGPAAKQVKIEWAKVRPHPRLDTIQTASSAGSAGQAANIVVNNVGMWRKDDIIYTPGNDAIAPLLVESVTTATSTLSVRALGIKTIANPTGFGTVPAFAKDDKIAWLGNAKAEKFTASTSRAMMPTYDFNYCELMNHQIDISLTRLATVNYTNMQDWPRTQREQATEFRRSLELKSWFGTASETTDASTSELRWTMNGVTRYIDKVLSYQKGAVGSPTIPESLLIDWLIQTFTGNNGSETRFLFADSYLSGEIMKVPLASLQSRRMEQVLGVKVLRLEFNFGVVYLKHCRIFNEIGKNHYGVILDMESIAKRTLRPMEMVRLLLEETGTDAKAIMLKEQSSLEVTNPDAHAEIIGV